MSKQSTISIDRLSPETITAIAIDLGELPKALVLENPAQPVGPSIPAETLAQFVGQRVRVTIPGRKMTVPGRMFEADGKYGLATNWGAEIDFSKEHIVLIEKKDVDTGRFAAVASV